MNNAEKADPSPFDPSAVTEVTLNLVIQVTPDLEPDVEQAVEDFTTILNSLGAVITNSHVKTPEEEQRAWEEALAMRRAENSVRYQLTDKEIEVLRLAGQGLSNGEIGSHLHVSLNTVKSHMQRIGHKMDTGDRVRMTGLFNGTIQPLRP